MRHLLTILIMLLPAAVLPAGRAVAADAAKAEEAKLDFARDVRPILSDRCYKCHGPGTAKAGLRLDRRDDALEAINLSDPAAGEFLRRITTDDPDERMPPDGKAKPLTPAEVETLRAWAAAGAKYETHWAYVKPQRPPAVAGMSGPDAIDFLVRRQVEKAGLTPAPPAEPGILLRRLSLDLTGLPPKAQELESFLADPSDENYRRHVERLLASPRFGEKWARQWLDLARYADSNGYQHDRLRTMWPYRDWVIRALNEDMPFDRFTIEQLAGDLLPNPTTDQLIATGFHRNTASNLAGGSISEEVEAQMKFDRVNTTGLVWLASTLECAQCHDHKFDPVTQKDYYELYAYFDRTPREVSENGTDTGGKRLIGPEIEVPLSPEHSRQVAALRERVAGLRAKLDELAPKALADREEWERTFVSSGGPDRIDFKALPPFARSARTLIGLPPGKRTSGTERRVLHVLFLDHPATRAVATELADAEAALEKVAPPRVMIMRDDPAPKESFVFERGVYTARGEAVTPGTIDALHPLDPAAPPNRLGLARWLVSRDNPLTARVTVNRWWAEVFGTGIVATLEDFGLQSEAPSHPELLDWLAVEFMESGWSMKHVLRTIVLTRTYRQTSRATVEQVAKDPANRLLSRGPRFRLPAELIRDNALAAAGQLSGKMFGPPIYPPQPDGLWDEIIGVVDPAYPVSTGEDRYRRGVYVVIRRGNANPSLLNFDGTDRGQCVVRRSRTNTPLQALAMLNDPVLVEAQRSLAGRIEAWPGDDADRAARAFREVLSRPPTHRELQTLLALRSRSGSWFDVAQALLNLDEFLNKN